MFQIYNHQMDKYERQEILVDFMEHPGFKLFYEKIIQNQIDMYEQALLEDESADNNTVLYTANTINKKMRKLLMTLKATPLANKTIHEVNEASQAE